MKTTCEDQRKVAESLRASTYYYILALYKNYLVKLRDLELKKKHNQITKADFYKHYEILKLAFAAAISAKLEHFIEEIERKED